MLFLRLLLLYRLWIRKAVARSNLRPFFCCVDRFAVTQNEAEDGRCSLEGLGVRGTR